MRRVVRGFGLDVTETDGAAVVQVAGDLDIATAPQLRHELLDLIGRSVRIVTVDLAQIDFIDSTGLAVLISGLKRLREGGGDLTLRSPSRTALRLLEITGLSKVFAIS